MNALKAISEQALPSFWRLVLVRDGTLRCSRKRLLEWRVYSNHDPCCASAKIAKRFEIVIFLVIFARFQLLAESDLKLAMAEQQVHKRY